MKHTFKRFVSALLALAMVAALVPAIAPTVAHAATVEEIEAANLAAAGGNDVAYFGTTFFLYDEAAANLYTRDTADKPGTVQVVHPTMTQLKSTSNYYYADEAMTNRVSIAYGDLQTASVYTALTQNPRYRTIRSSDTNTPAIVNNYYVYATINNVAGYYQLYVTRSTSGNTSTYTFYAYESNSATMSANTNNIVKTLSTTSTGNRPSTSEITLYTRTTTTVTPMYIVDSNGNRLEPEKTYTANNETAVVNLYAAVSGTAQNKGFYFSNGGNRSTTYPYYSGWVSGNGSTAAQNYYIYSGIAAEKLSESSNAPFADGVNAAKLFATSGNEDYVTVYKNVRVPYIYNPESGYYEFNSDNNGVYFADTPASGATLTLADKPSSYSYDSTYIAGCAPFNTLTTTTRSSRTSLNEYVTGYQISGSMVYGFGMLTSIPFQMTDDGKDENGNDITYTFSGDDDVWVYIDDTLVLDIGGIHNAVTGTINFVTGDVTLQGSAIFGNKVGDFATDFATEIANGTSITNAMMTNRAHDSISQTNLYEALGTTLTGFSAAGMHTMTIYYMDRGRGSTNAQMKFNLPQRDSVSLTKTIPENYVGTDDDLPIEDDVMAILNNIDFGFTIYQGNEVLANKTYTIEKDGTRIGSASTDANGHFTLKNGQTALFTHLSLDDEISYRIVEDQPEDTRFQTPIWSAESSVTGAQISGKNGYNSDTVTVDGSQNASDRIEFVCSNPYLYQSGVYVKGISDMVVLDYGLPTKINVLTNDVVTNGVVTGVTVVDYGDVYTAANFSVDDSFNIVFDPKGEVKEAVIKYRVDAKDPHDSDATAQSEPTTLTIVPATSVYYEDFSELIEYKQGFTKAARPADAYQEAQNGGYLDEATKTPFSPYGSDVYYIGTAGDSAGTVATGNSSSAYARFSYTFTGTGTAIYACITQSSGYVQVVVKDSTGAKKDIQYIDTVVLAGSGNLTEMKNTPIYNNPNIGSYGTYTVTVTLAKAGTPVSSSKNGSGAQLLLDGVRVYNPDKSATAQSAYARDGEKNTVSVNIAQTLAKNNAGSAFVTFTDTNGSITDLETYAKIGPSEEFYLAENSTMAFELVGWDSQQYSMFLYLKAPVGGTGNKLQIGSSTYTIVNGMACAYNISKDITIEKVTLNGEEIQVGTVTITGLSGTVAVSDLKVIGTEAFQVIKPDTDLSGGTQDDAAVTTYTLDDTTYNSGNLLLLPANTQLLGVDTEEEPAVFVPESITLSKTYSKTSRKATIQVKTSQDVAKVTINAVDAVRKTVSGKYVFAASFTKVTAGTTYEVIAYDANGVASEPYYIIVK